MGFDYVSISDTALEVTVGSDINPFIAALSDFSISSLTSVSQSLEDIFMNYYGGNKNV